MEAYEVITTLGEGTYGVVIKAKHRSTGRIVAIKKFKQSDEDEHVRKTSLREVRLLKQLQHPNIVPLLDVFRREGKLYIVFEYIEHTILQLLERTSHGLDPMDVRRYMYQLLRGVEFCHRHDVIHRDVKPENILVSRGGIVKLCDFGFARQITHRGKYTDYVATRWYRAPELLVGDVSYTKAVDIWAIGCIFAEITDTRPIFPGNSDLSQLQLILRCCGAVPSYMIEIFEQNALYRRVAFPQPGIGRSLAQRYPTQSPDWIDFLSACLRTDPEQRPSCNELMNMPYFTQKNFKQEYDAYLAQKAPLPRPARPVAISTATATATRASASSGDKGGPKTFSRSQAKQQKYSRDGSLDGVDARTLPDIHPSNNSNIYNSSKIPLVPGKAGTTVKSHEGGSRRDKTSVPASTRGEYDKPVCVGHDGAPVASVTGVMRKSDNKQSTSSHNISSNRCSMPNSSPALLGAGDSSESAETQHGINVHTQKGHQDKKSSNSNTTCMSNKINAQDANDVSCATANNPRFNAPTVADKLNPKGLGMSSHTTPITSTEQPGILGAADEEVVHGNTKPTEEEPQEQQLLQRRHNHDAVNHGKQHDQGSKSNDNASVHSRSVSITNKSTNRTNNGVANSSVESLRSSQDCYSAAEHKSLAASMNVEKKCTRQGTNGGGECKVHEPFQLPSISLHNASTEFQSLCKPIGTKNNTSLASTYLSNVSQKCYLDQKDDNSNAKRGNKVVDTSDVSKCGGIRPETEDENKAGSQSIDCFDVRTCGLGDGSVCSTSYPHAYFHPTKLISMARKQLLAVDTNTMMPSYVQQKQLLLQKQQATQDDAIVAPRAQKTQLVAGPPCTAGYSSQTCLLPLDKNVAPVLAPEHRDISESQVHHSPSELSHDRSNAFHGNLLSSSDALSRNPNSLLAKFPLTDGNSNSNDNVVAISTSNSHSNGCCVGASHTHLYPCASDDTADSHSDDGAVVLASCQRTEQHGVYGGNILKKSGHNAKVEDCVGCENGGGRNEERKRVRFELATVSEGTRPSLPPTSHSSDALSDKHSRALLSYATQTSLSSLQKQKQQQQQQHESICPPFSTSAAPSSSSVSYMDKTHTLPTDCDKRVDGTSCEPVKTALPSDVRRVYPLCSTARENEGSTHGRGKESGKATPLAWGRHSGNTFLAQRNSNHYNVLTKAQRAARNSRLPCRSNYSPQSTHRMLMSNAILHNSLASAALGREVNTTVVRDKNTTVMLPPTLFNSNRNETENPVNQPIANDFASTHDKSYTENKQSRNNNSKNRCSDYSSTVKGTMRQLAREVYDGGSTSSFASSTGPKIATRLSSSSSSPFTMPCTKKIYKGNVARKEQGVRNLVGGVKTGSVSSGYSSSERSQAQGRDVPRAKRLSQVSLVEQLVSGKLLPTSIREKVNHIVQRKNSIQSTRQKSTKN